MSASNRLLNNKFVTAACITIIVVSNSIVSPVFGGVGGPVSVQKDGNIVDYVTWSNGSLYQCSDKTKMYFWIYPPWSAVKISLNGLKPKILSNHTLVSTTADTSKMQPDQSFVKIFWDDKINLTYFTDKIVVFETGAQNPYICDEIDDPAIGDINIIQGLAQDK